MVIGLIIGLRITADQQRPEQTGAAAVRGGENDNSREKMQNVCGDSSAHAQSRFCYHTEGPPPRSDSPEVFRVDTVL